MSLLARMSPACAIRLAVTGAPAGMSTRAPLPLTSLLAEKAWAGAGSGRDRKPAAGDRSVDLAGAVDGVGAGAGPVDRTQKPGLNGGPLDRDLACVRGRGPDQQVPAGAVAGRAPGRSRAAGVSR